MKSNYKQLGQFIRQVDVRNAAGKEENLLGVSVQKTFIPSITTDRKSTRLNSSHHRIGDGGFCV